MFTYFYSLRDFLGGLISGSQSWRKQVHDILKIAELNAQLLYLYQTGSILQRQCLAHFCDNSSPIHKIRDLFPLVVVHDVLFPS